VRLHKLKASNFRLLQDFEIEFLPDITVVIGPNNAGKSNIVDAILFISQWMTPGAQTALGSRLGFDKIISQHRLDNIIRLDFTLQEGQDSAHYQVEIDRQSLKAETARVRGYEVRGVKIDGALSYIWGKTGERSGSFALDSGLIPMRPQDLVPITDFFAKIVAVDPFRQVIYQTNIGPKEMIAPNGADLATVLHYHHSNDRPRFQAFEMTVKRVLPEVEFIGTPIMGGPLTTVHLQFSEDPEKYNLWQISSGLKGVLVLLAAIYFSPPGSLIIIEEPENHLHPASQKGLSAVIKDAAAKENKQFIVTTHSEVILNQFGAEKAVFISRDGPKAKATPLPEAPLYQVWNRMGFERNLLLQALGRAPQVIAIMEGRGDQQALEPLWGHFDLKDKILPVTSGGGGWNEIVDSAKTLRESLARFNLRTDVFVLLDGNGNSAAKQQHMNNQGFSGDKGHVWLQKEVESYLLIPTALANISAQPVAKVQALVASNPGNPGKDRLERVLSELGIKGTPNNAIVQNALINCPGEISQEVLGVPRKIRKILGLPPL